ncbi:hypothetical protein HYU23_03485 [Candidatus Woesearchaeota archaeon]|nr:hypothetical protein [Candidatus Woesearchaeota archaeon]
MDIKGDREKLEILLTEYNKVQDSAEHHDQLNWNVALLFITLTGGLFVLLIKKEISNPIQYWMFSLFGVSLCLFAMYFSISFNKKINNKYTRAIEIEKIIVANYGLDFMQQHRQYENDKPQKGLYLSFWIIFALLYLLNLFFFKSL